MPGRTVRTWLRATSYVSVAAAVAMTATILWLGIARTRPDSSIRSIHSDSARLIAADHNNAYPRDTNVCDINGLR